jgi:predicted transcriptional regulator
LTYIRREKAKGNFPQNPNRRKIRKFSDQEISHIIKRWNEFFETEETNISIARSIAQELKRALNTVSVRIKSLIREGRIKEREIKLKPFSEEEVRIIVEEYNKLSCEELLDTEIAKRIGKKIGRDIRSITYKLRKLRGGGRIHENAGKRGKREYSDKDNEVIIRWYKELSLSGMWDGKIARILADKYGTTRTAMYDKIRYLKKTRSIRDNKNKKEEKTYTDKEIQLIIRMWEELSNAGCMDSEISKAISKEIDHSPASIRQKITTLRNEGKISENKYIKKAKKFTQEEIEGLTILFNRMNNEGFTDHQIAAEAGKRLGRNLQSIEAKLRRLRDRGIIGENKSSKPKRKYTRIEHELLSKRYIELIGQGLITMDIAKILSKELGRSPQSICETIRKMRKNGALVENPNTRFGNSDELEEGLARAAEAMEEFGDLG